MIALAHRRCQRMRRVRKPRQLVAPEFKLNWHGPGSEVEVFKADPLHILILRRPEKYGGIVVVVHRSPLGVIAGPFTGTRIGT